MKGRGVGDNWEDLDEDIEWNYTNLKLKRDAANRPIWVCPNRHIFLETFSPIYKQAYDFLIAIAEPVCRPLNVHEYKITAYSLYAAASLGLHTRDIISGLNRLSKTDLDPSLQEFIKEKTERCGKVKLLLKTVRSRLMYTVETLQPEILHILLKEEAISGARIDDIALCKPDTSPVEKKPAPIMSTTVGTKAPIKKKILTKEEKQAIEEIDLARRQMRDPVTGFLISKMGQQEGLMLFQGTKEAKLANEGNISASGGDVVFGPRDTSNDQTDRKVYFIEMDPNKVEHVRRVSNEIGYPMLEEYDFRKDTTSPDLPINLKPITSVRPYQEKCLSKMFGNGRARSGIIVLPCGAGKTLVGVTTTTTIKKSTIVFCTTAIACEQWRRQFLKWTSLPDKYIKMFTSGRKEAFTTDSFVVITTFHMVAFNGKRAAEAEEAMNVISCHEWGLVVLDEVHVAPARMFRRCVSITHSRCKLGLTATLVREDDLIGDLFFLIGPKLYEANWIDLQNAGYIATVQCVEVWCDMTAEFYRSYLRESARKRRLLYAMNPGKFRACEYLIRLHEARGDKVLVFSDNVFALEHYAQLLKRPYIYGSTSIEERSVFLHKFQHSRDVNTLFISKIGDNSIDLPDVNVIVQISSHFAARRQEAQRLGRILRPKKKSLSQFNAFFYTLVSRDTTEMKYATKRQRFLVDQGYSFKILTSLPNMPSDLRYGTKEEQQQLLLKCLSLEDRHYEIEGEYQDKIEADARSASGTYSSSNNTKKRSSTASRKKGNMKSLSGGDHRLYAEVNKNRRPNKKKKADYRSKIFKKRQKKSH